MEVRNILQHRLMIQGTDVTTAASAAGAYSVNAPHLADSSLLHVHVSLFMAQQRSQTGKGY